MKPLTVASLFASTIVGAELEAQKLPPTAADAASILKAPVPSGGYMQFMKIVGDTAVVNGVVVRVTVDTTQTKDAAMAISTANFFDPWEARVERRKGKWVLVRRKTT